MIELFNKHIWNFLDQESGFDEDDIQVIKSKYKTEMLPISGPSEKCWENSWSLPVLTKEKKINLKNIWNESLSP